MKLTYRIPLFVGGLALIVSLGGGLASIVLSSRVISGMGKDSLHSQAQTGARMIREELVSQLAILQEVANRETVRTMDWPAQQQSLEPDVDRLGYLDFGIVTPDGISHYILENTTSDLSDRSYVMDALSGKQAISDVLISKVIGTPVVMFAVPIVENDSVVGALIARKDGNALSEKTNTLGFGTSGYSYLVNREGVVIAHQNTDLVLAQYSPIEAAKTDPSLSGLAAIFSDMKQGKEGEGSYFYQGKKLLVGYMPVGVMDWMIAVTIEKRELMWGVTYLRNIILLTSFIFLGIALAIGIYLSSSIIKTVGGEPAEIAAIADEVATGNLSITIPDSLNPTGIYKSLLFMIERLKEIASAIINAANQVSAGSRQLSATAQAISRGAAAQATSVEGLTSSMQEMLSNIKKTAENARITDKTAQQSAAEAENGGKAVSRTVDAMKVIASKTSIIEEIARSTNMLALNASIEAARAETYGKGFAVVATEVGKLAERSKKEAVEISKLSADSVEIAENAGNTINNIIPDIKQTAALVQEITISSDKQDSESASINQAISQLDTVVQQNASAAEESASMSEELAAQATRMQETISFFKIEEVVESV